MKKWAYYNEVDPFAAEWIRKLMSFGIIMGGEVDERSIEDVRPDDVKSFVQCHWFAGVAVWSYSLRQAGWPDDKPIWTGSCPCQPFSAAGKGAGFDDERHLWPSFQWLIEQCKPAIVLGEQVASKAVEPWIDLVQADVEALGYAFGCVPFPAAGVGAPNLRDRAWWVAEPNSDRQQSGSKTAPTLGYGHTTQSNGSDGRPSPTNGFWADADWLHCRDGKWRPVEPGTSPLVDGTANRVGRLRGYGNAINAQAAQAFIESVMEVI